MWNSNKMCDKIYYFHAVSILISLLCSSRISFEGHKTVKSSFFFASNFIRKLSFHMSNTFIETHMRFTKLLCMQLFPFRWAIQDSIQLSNAENDLSCLLNNCSTIWKVNYMRICPIERIFYASLSNLCSMPH